MTDSPQQLAIYSHLTSASGHFSIRASAGSGKTTTLVGLATRTSPSDRVYALSFNKEIADTLAKRMPFWVNCSTHHSLMLKVCRNAKRGTCKPDASKCKYFLKDLVPDWNERKEIQDAVLSLVSYAKGYAYDAGGDWSLSDLADHFSVDATNQILNLAAELLDLSASRWDILDFDDMLWFPLRHNLPFDGLELLLVDEAQDTNVTQALLLEKQMAKGGRLVIVGDPFQSIYGFRGSAPDAMESLETKFNMTVLPLSVSYRCSKAVVEEANRVLEKPIRKPLREKIDECDELRFEQEPLQ